MSDLICQCGELFSKHSRTRNAQDSTYPIIYHCPSAVFRARPEPGAEKPPALKVLCSNCQLFFTDGRIRGSEIFCQHCHDGLFGAESLPPQEVTPHPYNIRLPDKTCWRCKQPTGGNYYAVCFQCATPAPETTGTQEVTPMREAGAWDDEMESLEPAPDDTVLVAIGRLALYGFDDSAEAVAELARENACLQRQVDAVRGLTAKQAMEYYMASGNIRFADDFIRLLREILDAAARGPEAETDSLGKAIESARYTHPEGDRMIRQLADQPFRPGKYSEYEEAREYPGGAITDVQFVNAEVSPKWINELRFGKLRLASEDMPMPPFNAKLRLSEIWGLADAYVSSNP